MENKVVVTDLQQFCHKLAEHQVPMVRKMGVKDWKNNWGTRKWHYRCSEVFLFISDMALQLKIAELIHYVWGFLRLVFANTIFGFASD